MRADVSAEAGEFVRGQGGRLWVWAAHPAVCCAGRRLRAPAGQFPDVLEIAMRGRRRPRIEAYWDGCRFAL